jgi:hypothetical protein
MFNDITVKYQMGGTVNKITIHEDNTITMERNMYKVHYS